MSVSSELMGFYNPSCVTLVLFMNDKTEMKSISLTETHVTVITWKFIVPKFFELKSAL